MGKGLPKKYAKMGFKKGWAAYKRSKKGGTKKTTRKKAPKRKYTKTRASTKRRKSTMARRKKRGSRKQGIVSLAINGITLGIAAAPILMNAKEYLFSGDYQGFANATVKDYTGLSMESGAVGFNPMEAKGLFALGGAVIFKKGFGVVQKHVRIKL